MIREIEVRTVPGLPMLLIGVGGVLLAAGLIAWAAASEAPLLLAVAIPLLLASAYVLARLTTA
jgi:hypothetical protein